MNRSVKIFRTPKELAESLAGELVFRISEAAIRKKIMTIALSGGSTPELLFSLIGDNYGDATDYRYLHLFWGDERCVPPDNKESNYGVAKEMLIDKINIPEANIHRIHGENNPQHEVVRYSKEITESTRRRDGLPNFDIIILGLGEDGHTASIFPGSEELLFSENICEVAFHPVTKQSRITITGRVINNSESVIFLVTGSKKAEIIRKIIREGSLSVDCPAASINPVHGKLEWMIDEEAAGLIND